MAARPTCAHAEEGVDLTSAELFASRIRIALDDLSDALGLDDDEINLELVRVRAESVETQLSYLEGEIAATRREVERLKGGA